MSTESTIVKRSRMALKTGDKMRINPPESIVRMIMLQTHVDNDV